MLRNRKIAMFIDVDNTEMDFEQYKSAVDQVASMGEIVCATVYGASERKQKGIIDAAKQSGFSVQLPARMRKRIRKVFDDRIYVDVVDLVAHSANIDTVAVVAYPADMVYLFSYLRRLGLQVVGSDALDEAGLALTSDTVKIENKITEEPKKAAKRQTVSKSAVGQTKATAASKSDLSRTAAAKAQSGGNSSVSAASGNADLVDRVDEVSQNSFYESDDGLVDEIRKLLQGLD